MIWVEGQEFTNQEIKLDFTILEKWRFRNCTIMVQHGEYDLVNCQFYDCRLNLFWYRRDKWFEKTEDFLIHIFLC